MGNTANEVRHLPDSARQRIGRQLRQVQRGHEPDDWKPMKTVGAGCREIRIRTDDGQFRSIYIASGTPPGVYVLAVFTKKSQATPTAVIELARKRFKTATEHMKGRRNEH